MENWDLHGNTCIFAGIYMCIGKELDLYGNWCGNPCGKKWIYVEIDVRNIYIHIYTYIIVDLLWD